MTTDPRDQGLEERLEYTINQETEVINIKLKDAAIVGVRRGSVIIEIQVQPGQNIGSVWLQAVVESILTEKVKECLPSGNRLTLDIESNVIVPLADLGGYRKEFSFYSADHTRFDGDSLNFIYLWTFIKLALD